MTPGRRVARANHQLARLRAEAEIRIPVYGSCHFGPTEKGIPLEPGAYRLWLTVRSLFPAAPIPTVVFTEVPA